MVVTNSLKMSVMVSMLAVLTVAQNAEAKRIRLRHTPDPINVCRMVLPNTQGFDQDKTSGLVREDSLVTQQVFMDLMSNIENIYQPVIAQQGAKLVIDKLWDNNEANAYADRPTPKLWNIHMFGGLARHPYMTRDAMMLVACHELGHHMGGAPTYTDGWNASSEGEADYYGTLKCMRVVIGQLRENSVSIMNDPSHHADVTPQVQQKCQAYASNAQAFATCEREVIAGERLAAVLYDLETQEDPQRSLMAILMPQIGNPDRTVVPTTLFDKYPGLQCRLDTYIAGANCPANPVQLMDAKDPSRSACIAQSTAASLSSGSPSGPMSPSGGPLLYPAGSRPLCWFNPNSVAGFRR